MYSEWHRYIISIHFASVNILFAIQILGWNKTETFQTNEKSRNIVFILVYPCTALPTWHCNSKRDSTGHQIILGVKNLISHHKEDKPGSFDRNHFIDRFIRHDWMCCTISDGVVELPVMNYHNWTSHHLCKFRPLWTQMGHLGLIARDFLLVMSNGTTNWVMALRNWTHL